RRVGLSTAARQRRPRHAAGAQLDLGRARPREESVPSRLPRFPRPERRLEPAILTRQVRHRMAAAANSIFPPVAFHRAIVALAKTCQLIEHMADEPGKRFRAVEIADGNLQVSATPLSFKMAARPHDALTQIAGSFSLVNYSSPKCLQERLEFPALG